MAVLPFIATILLVAVSACFTICVVGAVTFAIYLIIDDLWWKWEHRRK